MSRIYFVQAGPIGGDGLIKIGRSKHVEVRLDNLRCGCPIDLNLIDYSREFGEFGHSMERRIHDVFVPLRRPRSEWFRPHPAIYEAATFLKGQPHGAFLCSMEDVDSIAASIEEMFRRSR